jgi:hypothetical protein
MQNLFLSSNFPIIFYFSHMASFLDLFSLKRKAKKALSTYEDLINDRVKEECGLKTYLPSQCQSLVDFWKFATKKGTW